LDGKPGPLGDVRGMAKFDDFLVAFVEKYGKPDVIVVEDFRLWRWKAQKQSGSNMPASKVIGKIELWARMHNIPVVMQKPQDKDMGAKWSGIKTPGNHDQSHHIVAYNHAVFYLVMNKMLNPLGMEKLDAPRST
jgi:hypothetical protein